MAVGSASGRGSGQPASRPADVTDRPVPVQRYLCPQRPASRDRPQEGRDTEPPHVRIGRNFLAFSETSAPHAFKSENSKSREAERLAGAAGLGSRLGRGPISAGASALLSGRLSASARGRQGPLRPCLGRCERLGGHTAHASVGTRGSSPGVSPGRVCLPCLAGGPRESFAVCTPQRPAWGTLCPDCTCPQTGQAAGSSSAGPEAGPLGGAGTARNETPPPSALGAEGPHVRAWGGACRPCTGLVYAE